VTTRDGISMIIPNHQLVSEKLINWSTSDTITRFKINVGVAYGSNVELVKKILEECAWKHSKVITNPAPVVFFKDFGDSSLDFELVFWSNQLFPIDHIMSDLRYQIEESFRVSNITIPFPQRDLHIKSGDSLS
jgi:small-conductance mechanosensitive channel